MRPTPLPVDIAAFNRARGAATHGSVPCINFYVSWDAQSCRCRQSHYSAFSRRLRCSVLFLVSFLRTQPLTLLLRAHPLSCCWLRIFYPVFCFPPTSLSACCQLVTNPRGVINSAWAALCVPLWDLFQCRKCVFSQVPRFARAEPVELVAVFWA